MTALPRDNEYLSVQITLDGGQLTKGDRPLRRSDLRRYANCLASLSENALIAPDEMVDADLYGAAPNQMRAEDLAA